MCEHIAHVAAGQEGYAVAPHAKGWQAPKQIRVNLCVRACGSLSLVYICLCPTPTAVLFFRPFPPHVLDCGLNFFYFVRV